MRIPHRGGARWHAGYTPVVFAALVCFFALSLPAAAQATPLDCNPCDLRDEVRALNTSLRELVELVRTELRRIEEAEGVKTLVTLDQAIQFLDTSLRQVLEERAKLADELTDLRAQEASSAKTADDAKTDPSTRLQLRGFLPVLSEKIARLEERLAHLDTRVQELRDSIRLRQQKLKEIEKANGKQDE